LRLTRPFSLPAYCTLAASIFVADLDFLQVTSSITRKLVKKCFFVAVSFMKHALPRGPINQTATIFGFFTSLLGLHEDEILFAYPSGLSLFFGCLPCLRPRENWSRNGVVNRSYPLIYTRLWFGCWFSLVQAEG
jgi:hypothetical protein